MLSVNFYRALLHLYPAAFRHEYGGEMSLAFADELRHARESGRKWHEGVIWIANTVDVLITAPKEHLHVMHQDLRYALRSFAATPGFSAVAILSLAFGIGANTAIFSLLSSVLLSTLPVRDPGSLVILTDPSVAGVSTGSSTGERNLMTYSEFLLMQDEVESFDGVIASSSALRRLDASISGGAPEDMRVRLVSAGYFDVLGVGASVGRVWSGPESDSPSAEPEAVLSHEYWRRRFAGEESVLGTKVQIGRGTFTVTGVMPASFFGETVGERPDAWIPLSAQALALPGRDWLRDVPGRVEKVMWLHVLARLEPGITLETAQANANVLFQRSMASYYGSRLDEATAKRYAEQSLKLRLAANGASRVRGRFAEPLYVLLAAAAVVLLIACANLGNLLLARVTARSREMAVRLALGAGRGRLVRQMLTESLALAFAGGIAGIGVAFLMRRGLLLLVDDSVRLPESLDLRVMVFAFCMTVATGVLLGMLPALRLFGTPWGRSGSARSGSAEALSALREEGRSALGSAASLRMGRAVVVGQLALSVPLLVGAGLLVLTLYNLQRVDLGFPKDGVLMVHVDLSAAGYPAASVPSFLEGLRDRLGQVPGVNGVTYSNNGVFMGSDSGDRIEVEGYSPKDGEPYGASYDQVGPGFFSTLGVPLLRGREITDRDVPPAMRACVVNEAFAKEFFAERDPLGRQITQIFGSNRNTCEVVGVSANSRTNELRDQVEPRFYLPALQPVDALSHLSYALRTGRDPAALVEPVRRLVAEMNPNLPMTRPTALPEIIDDRLVQDRLLARFSITFGGVALLLSVMGLYGVLSFAVARRTREIGLRKALGAQQHAVLAMIFRETGWMLAVGLLLGVGLSVGLLRLIASRLYGLEPTDPAMYFAAIVILTAVALLSSWLPAHRASRVDPVIALRYD